jgi:hypothetical protein
MKTSKLIYSVIIAFGFLLFSCDSPSGNEIMPRPLPKQDDDLRFRSTVYFHDQQNIINADRINELIRTKLKTNGFSTISKLSFFDIELSHVAIKMGLGNTIRLEDGEMLIRGSNGDQLFGKYHGFGSVDTNKGDLKLMINITGGTGYFSGMHGYLSGYCQNYGWDHRMGEMEFSGQLLRDNLPI